MYASALVTAYGRKILKYMIDYVETNGGIIIECDTDGIFFSAKNGEEIYQGLKQKLNSEINFDIELEYKDCVMYASDKKNYIIITQDNKVIKKGSKYAGRDKSRLQTEFVVEYIKKFVKDPAEAEKYKRDTMNDIFYRRAFDLLKVTRKVSKNDKTIIEDAKAKGIQISHGSIISYVYSDYKAKKYTFEGENTNLYDVNYYLKEFEKLMREIKDVINSTSSTHFYHMR
jgi:DNA polymerase elongation subunit (family B)